jgi:hypothetical protein
VTVLAYALGEENLFDANGNNVFDAGDSYVDKGPDIFRNDDESGVTPANLNGTWTAGEPCIGLNSNKACSTPGDGQYNGVLRYPQVQSAQTLYVSGQLVQLYSGSHATIAFNQPALTCAPNSTTDVLVTVTDEIGNVLPAKTSIGFEVLFGAFSGMVLPAKAVVPNVVLGVGDPLIIPSYLVSLGCLAGNGKFLVTVTTPNGIQSVRSIAVTTVAP